jgi:hypothetical protein
VLQSSSNLSLTPAHPYLFPPHQASSTSTLAHLPSALVKIVSPMNGTIHPHKPLAKPAQISAAPTVTLGRHRRVTANVTPASMETQAVALPVWLVIPGSTSPLQQTTVTHPRSLTAQTVQQGSIKRLLVRYWPRCALPALQRVPRPHLQREATPRMTAFVTLLFIRTRLPTTFVHSVLRTRGA